MVADINVQQTFRHKSENTLLVIVIAADVQAFVKVEQNIEQPCAVGIDERFVGDKHIAAAYLRAVSDFCQGGGIFGTTPPHGFFQLEPVFFIMAQPVLPVNGPPLFKQPENALFAEALRFGQDNPVFRRHQPGQFAGIQNRFACMDDVHFGLVGKGEITAVMY